MSQHPEHDIRQKLAADIDIAPWSALVRHFAFGRVQVVRAPWDLLDAALALHQDDKQRVQDAISRKLLVPPTPEEARHWHETNASFDMLVISPFVLIQAKEERQA